ncbi:MAG: metalloprotease [Planctomycetota bacterium]|jgi:stage IV sporulation protein FB
MLRLRVGGLHLRVHPGLALVAAALFLVGRDLWLRYLALLGVLLLHELGHAMTAIALGGRRSVVTIWPWGGVAHVPRRKGVRQALVALAGPAANLVAAGVLAVFGGQFSYHLGGCPLPDLLFTGNLVMGLGNLIPLPPLDGGRVLQNLREKNPP